MATKTPEPGSKREALVEKHGFDTKFAYHLVRLLYEVEQILTTGDIDLRRNAHELTAILNGRKTEEEIRQFSSEKEKALERIYAESTVIPYGPREDEIKQLLLDCLETHYGSLQCCIVSEKTPILALREIAAIIDKHRELLQ